MLRAEIEKLLPGVFQRALTEHSPLGAVLDVMETLHEPAERMLERLPEVFDPRRTDERYLTMLAHWVNLDRLYPAPRAGESALDWSPQTPPIPPGRMRELIANAAYLSQWRGTARGLERFLEIVTGLRPFILHEQISGEDGAIVPYHVRVVAPEEAQPYGELIERVVELEKPAYVTWELVWA